MTLMVFTTRPEYRGLLVHGMMVWTVFQTLVQTAPFSHLNLIMISSPISTSNVIRKE